MTITDSIGTWENIGEIPLSLDWEFAPNEIINGNLFRFTYNVDWSQWAIQLDGKSFAIARFYYPSGDNTLVTSSFKLFPKQYKEIRQLTIPQDLLNKGIVIRSIGAKAIRLGLYSRLIGTPIIPWTLGIEYLLHD